MYELLAIDSVLRITFALAVLFVLVPRLAWPRTPAQNALQRFWFDLGWGIVVLTIAGQLLTLAKLYALPTLLLLCALVILLARSAAQHRSPVHLLAEFARTIVVGAINILDGRVSLRRRARRLYRRAHFRMSRTAAGWIGVTAVAALFRLYRPFATANLGYSDSYVHLYLVKLLDEGRQVDPAWGPYPRGMHFLLLAIQRLTNIDEILLVNFFGAFAGILLTLAVAYTARRLASSDLAGLVAGFLFATMAGGARQYFIVGGSFESTDANWLHAMTHAAYNGIPAGAGEFDVLLTVFQRQSSTLSQELAIVLLFPAALFLLDWFDTRSNFQLAGFIGCTAAIAATHSGVLVPLVLLCGIIAIAELLTRTVSLRDVGHGAAAGAAAILLGSSWLLGFIAYPFVRPGTKPGATALFYFPFLRRFAGDAAGGTMTQEVAAYNMITPLLIVLAFVAVALIVLAHTRGHAFAIAGMTYLVFFAIHAASRIGLPQIVESRRNSEWFLVSIAVLIAVALTALPNARAMHAVSALLVVAWLTRVPPPQSLRGQLLNYSGYGSASLAVLEIAHKYEPYSWTLVSYGQEYPMVLGNGFHMAASQFLQHYDPAEPELPIPTRYVFVLTERVPHRFEVADWRTRFSRSEIERRLQTWCTLYGATHDDLRVFLDDGNVQVFEIARSEAEANRIAKEARVQ